VITRLADDYVEWNPVGTSCLDRRRGCLSIAKFLDLQFPIFAAVAAVIATDLVPSETFRLGQRRLLGTVVGAICGTGLRVMVQPSPWTLGLGVLLAMLVANLLRLPEGARLAGYVSALIVVVEGVDPWVFALVRLLRPHWVSAWHG